MNGNSQQPFSRLYAAAQEVINHYNPKGETMTLTFKPVRHPGDPTIYVAKAETDNVHSYEVEPDGDHWSVNVLRRSQQLMGPLHTHTVPVSTFADDMRFSNLRFRTLADAQAACNLHHTQEANK